MNLLSRYILLLLIAAGGVITTRAQPVIYTVNRSFTDGSLMATLTGTVDIPLGSYTIQNESASPFTSINLTLAAGGNIYHLDEAITTYISGTGQFFIDAASTTLTFNTANANGNNPADLSFASPPESRGPYAIGSDSSPGFEIAIVSAEEDIVGNLTMPVVFWHRHARTRTFFVYSNGGGAFTNWHLAFSGKTG
jgi:hypothetical protein